MISFKKSKISILRSILLVLFLVSMAFIIPNLTIDDSIQNWLPRDLNLINDYKNFLENFKSDAIIIISIVDSSEKSSKPISMVIDKLIQEISNLPHVTNVMNWPPPFLRSKTKPAQNIHSFFLTFRPPSHMNPNRPELIDEVTKILETAGVEYHIAGTGVIHKAINEETKQASRKFLGIGLFILLLFLILILRNIQIVLKTIGISLGGVAVVLLTAYLLKIEFNMAIAILPILIMFYSTSVSVHIFNHGGAFKKILWPTLTAVLTTCAGFSVFLLEPIPLLRDFGLLAISGLVGGFLWAAIFYFPRTSQHQIQFPYRERIHKMQNLWNIKSLALGIVLLAVFIPGALKIKSEININSTLPSDNQSLMDYFFIEKNVGLYMPIEYLVNIGQVVSQDVRLWIEDVYQLENVGGVMSYMQIPRFLDPQSLGYVSKDGQVGRVTFFIPMMSTTEGLKLVNQIEDKATNHFSYSAAIPKPTGYSSLYVVVADSLSRSFRKSLILAFIFVFFIIFIYLRSFKLFFASIFPNLFPIVAMMGVMGWSRIPLDMVTVPIGCLALGTIVDNSIHLLYWYRKTGDVQKAFSHAGPGIIVTSVILILGFSVFLFAQAPPARNFGILSIAAMFMALFGDAVLLPTILQWSKRQKKSQRSFT